jgi:hypothetical protein
MQSNPGVRTDANIIVHLKNFKGLPRAYVKDESVRDFADPDCHPGRLAFWI